MKSVTNITITAIFLLLVSIPGFCQKCPTAQGFHSKRKVSEISLGIGASHYFGDLNSINLTNKRVVGELHAEQINPVLSINYRYYFSHIVNLRVQFLYTRINGSDQYNAIQEDFSASWFRRYRNLTFRSDVVELSACVELNIPGFQPGDFKRVVSPYLVAGAGVLYFNPKAPYDEELQQPQLNEKGILPATPDYSGYEWVRLQPLGTEGQGLPGYASRYSLIQPVFIAGVGLKFHIASSWTMTVEASHHFTLTDYLDDVSTVYPDQQDFFQYYNPEKALMISSLSVRSKEVDPSGNYEDITSTGQQRGNPNHKDSFLTSLVTIGYAFLKK